MGLKLQGPWVQTHAEMLTSFIPMRTERPEHALREGQKSATAMGFSLLTKWDWKSLPLAAVGIRQSRAVRKPHSSPTWFSGCTSESHSISTWAWVTLIKQQKIASGLETLQVQVEVTAKLLRGKEKRAEKKARTIKLNNKHFPSRGRSTISKHTRKRNPKEKHPTIKS